jgi:hypothetical protein
MGQQMGAVTFSEQSNEYLRNKYIIIKAIKLMFIQVNYKLLSLPTCIRNVTILQDSISKEEI